LKSYQYVHPAPKRPVCPQRASEKAPAIIAEVWF
jgi:hypothetical protein